MLRSPREESSQPQSRSIVYVQTSGAIQRAERMHASERSPARSKWAKAPRCPETGLQEIEAAGKACMVKVRQVCGWSESTIPLNANDWEGVLFDS